MCRLSLALLFAVIRTSAAGAQSLEVGGIELRLGQDVPAALRSLAAYSVAYDDQLEMWFVKQTVAGRAQILGHLTAADGKLSLIRKAFPLSANDDVSLLYTQAYREVRRLGGDACTLSESLYSDGRVRAITTACGRYEFSYSLPFIRGRDLVGAGLTITLVDK